MRSVKNDGPRLPIQSEPPAPPPPSPRDPAEEAKDPKLGGDGFDGRPTLPPWANDWATQAQQPAHDDSIKPGGASG